MAHGLLAQRGMKKAQRAIRWPEGDTGRLTGCRRCVRHLGSRVKLAAVLVTPPGVATVIGPLVAPAGTVAQT